MFFIITIRNYEDRETKRFSSLSYSIMNKGLYIGVYDKFVDRLIAVNYGNGNCMEENPGGRDKRFFDDIEEIVCLAVLIIN